MNELEERLDDQNFMIFRNYLKKQCAYTAFCFIAEGLMCFFALMWLLRHGLFSFDSPWYDKPVAFLMAVIPMLIFIMLTVRLRRALRTTKLKFDKVERLTFWISNLLLAPFGFHAGYTLASFVLTFILAFAEK